MSKGINFFREDGSVGHFDGSWEQLIASEEHEPEPEEEVLPYAGIKMVDGDPDDPEDTEKNDLEDTDEEILFPAGLKMEDE